MDTTWHPSNKVKGLMYKEQITTQELKEAIIDCWLWMFGDDPIYKQMLQTQFNKEIINTEHPRKENLLKVIDNIESVACSFKVEEISKTSINRLKVLSKKCADMELSTITIEVSGEDSILEARESSLVLSNSIGFNKTDQVKIATAISELARNITRYAERGTIELIPIINRDQKGLKIIAIDQGPGIEHLDEVLSGTYNSKDGLGIGLLGTKRLTDEFSGESGSGKGTKVIAIKYL
jgi:serine/threonine-protein kinase RsbT